MHLVFLGVLGPYPKIVEPLRVMIALPTAAKPKIPPKAGIGLYPPAWTPAWSFCLPADDCVCKIR